MLNKNAARTFFGKARQFAGARNFKAFLFLWEPEQLRLMERAKI
jgi:hypothetical protein